MHWLLSLFFVTEVCQILSVGYTFSLLGKLRQPLLLDFEHYVLSYVILVYILHSFHVRIKCSLYFINIPNTLLLCYALY